MLPDSLTDRVLGLARAGKPASALEDRVAELFVELRGDVFRYLITLGLNPPQAQEATQEVFLRLYETLKRSDDIANPRAWIFRVAHNYGLKVRARESYELPYDAEAALRLADPDVNPEISVIERERLLRFHHAVESLSEQQRRCLLLRLEGLRYGEIGAVLGISASAVGEFLRRAIARLRALDHA
jgi:RNA polymerase sigma-70 factor (ECF subfamily)